MNEPARWKSRVLGVALATLAVILTGAMVGLWSLSPRVDLAIHSQPAVAWTVVATLTSAALLSLLSSFDRRSGSMLRLDWFTPMIRRERTGSRAAPSLAGRIVRGLLPANWQSDWSKKRRGPLRRFLRALGPSWLASPVRRAVQAACLITFCGLFFYTCWPYDARPVQHPLLSQEWTFAGFDQARNQLSFSGPGSEALQERQGESIAIVRQTGAPAGRDEDRLLGEFVVESLVSGESGAARLVVSPRGDTTGAMLALITSGDDGRQPFAIYDSNPFAWPSHYADNLSGKEWIPAETFLMIDPLVSLSTAVASRSWVWSLASAAAILIVCILIPRGFCGYLCPLGTTIDLFDWAVTARTKRFQVPGDGWWVHIKYYLLGGILVAACFGVLISGFFSAIPVITRGLLFLADPLQSGTARGWHLIPSFNAGHAVSIAMFLGVLGLGFMRPRFWCKYVCPSGAVFSLSNLFRVTERKVESSCIHCNKCVEVCPFDAIKPDFTTRETDCTLCQTCGGVCPTHAIKFVDRLSVFDLKADNEPPTGETAIGRRGFLSLAAGTAAAVVGGSAAALGTKAFGAKLDRSLPIVDAPGARSFLPVRPPGSVPEQEFLQMCIRCGECFKACPNNVLQPEGFQQGLEGLWTPMVNANWAGCESSCNACGQVCPTGAIRALPLEEKRVARMGLAIVNESTCLPFAQSEACDLCVQECDAAGYHAIEYTQVGVELDERGQPIEGTGFAAPVVLADKCVGCGLCQTRCHAINVKERHVLQESAIIVEAGEGNEDRIMDGSYRELRDRRAETEGQPNAIEPAPIAPSQTGQDLLDDDPFGTGGGGAASNEESPF